MVPELQSSWDNLCFEGIVVRPGCQSAAEMSGQLSKPDTRLK